MSLNALASAISQQGEQVRGLTDEEIRRVATDQGVSSLPRRYVEFLSVLGVKAGKLFVGTDIFYPEILGIKDEARDLLRDEGVGHLMAEDVIVFALHQGYNAYWLTDIAQDDPPVCWYVEGDQELRGTWSTFSEFLAEEAERAGVRWRP